MLLAEETLKIVLAFIAIGFLVYFLVSLWMANQDSKDLELAKASLQHLVDEINDGRKSVEIYNPEGYWLMSWPHGNEKPLYCENLNWDNCLCICGNPGVFSTIKDLVTSHTKIQSFAEECDGWVCSKPKEQMVVVSQGSQGPIKIEEPPLNLEIKDGKITKK